jgi:hypothetical protein
MMGERRPKWSPQFSMFFVAQNQWNMQFGPIDFVQAEWPMAFALCLALYGDEAI